MMTVGLSPCLAKRIYALLRSKGPGRDVWVLVDEHTQSLDTPEWRPLVKAGLRLDRQPMLPSVSPDRSHSWHSFGGERSGLSKPAFVLWAANRTSEYRYFWHLEDDTYFSGPWVQFFDAFFHSGADLISRRTKFAGKLLGEVCEVRGTRCLEKVVGKVSWPVIRLSSRLLADLASALDEGHTLGHHEFLMAGFCGSQAWCVHEDMLTEYSDVIGKYVLGGWGKFISPMTSRTAAASMLQTSEMDATGKYCGEMCCTLDKLNQHRDALPNRIYHPVKCDARLCGNPAIGERALKESLGPGAIFPES